MVNEILHDIHRYEERTLKTRNRMIEAVWRVIDPVKDGFVMCRDNFIQAKYFQEMDGSDNIFCSQDCACQYLSIERVYQTEDGGLM